MDEDQVILSRIGIDDDGVPNVKEPIFIILSSFKGSKYLDVRKYFQDREGEWRPTKKGVTLHADQLEEFKKILEDNKQKIDGWFNS